MHLAYCEHPVVGNTSALPAQAPQMLTLRMRFCGLKKAAGSHPVAGKAAEGRGQLTPSGSGVSLMRSCGMPFR